MKFCIPHITVRQDEERNEYVKLGLKDKQPSAVPNEQKQ